MRYLVTPLEEVLQGSPQLLAGAIRLVLRKERKHPLISGDLTHYVLQTTPPEYLVDLVRSHVVFVLDHLPEYILIEISSTERVYSVKFPSCVC